ncbi:copper homeostasis protein CutC [Floricoccus tropicus]|uniref:PF03932 family protein CutC n=1 Tax=Floricoccus tropicus TaxID=1859473 RepID=A0A1E8GKP7_9LACT|nr:copper homeostasis protein CutC [Floricoccus tropicus]OFI48243.1 copper homeostasis protein CutC [Floricoccus tropicus]
MIIKEFCAENFTDIPKAILAGATRIELCDNLAVGGTTPSYGVIKEAASYTKDDNIPLAVIIRPRGGNFVYNSTEVKIMEEDVLKAAEAGATALVMGALTEDNNIDKETMETLLIASQGLQITFHMAFDEIEDWKPAMDYLIDEGVEKILAHGGPLDKPLNIDKIKEMVEYADGRIDIIIGGGVTYNNAEELAHQTGTNYVHGTKIVEF